MPAVVSFASMPSNPTQPEETGQRIMVAPRTSLSGRRSAGTVASRRGAALPCGERARGRAGHRGRVQARRGIRRAQRVARPQVRGRTMSNIDETNQGEGEPFEGDPEDEAQRSAERPDDSRTSRRRKKSSSHRVRSSRPARSSVRRRKESPRQPKRIASASRPQAASRAASTDPHPRLTAARVPRQSL